MHVYVCNSMLFCLFSMQNTKFAAIRMHGCFLRLYFMDINGKQTIIIIINFAFHFPFISHAIFGFCMFLTLPAIKWINSGNCFEIQSTRTSATACFYYTLFIMRQTPGGNAKSIVVPFFSLSFDSKLWYWNGK